MSTDLPDARRAVVTGMGAVSSIGIGREAFWTGLLAGESGVGPVRAFNSEEYPTGVAAEIVGFMPERWIALERVASYGRSSQFAIAATRLALDDASLDAADISAERARVLVGTTTAEGSHLRETIRSWVEGGKGPLERDAVIKMGDCLLAHNVARELELPIDGAVIPTACAAGSYAIGYGFDLIRAGEADLILTGGSDDFGETTYAGFARMRSLSPDLCRPFDKNRKGIVIGEGAAMLVLESRERALARGAHILAEMIGYGLSCDAKHMTIPQRSGVVTAMERAIEDAGVTPDDVDMICAHGTGTQANDATESEAIAAVLGDHAFDVVVPSIKSMLGHTMGAASVLETVACVMALVDQKAPPTINYETPDEACPLDYVPSEARDVELKVVLNNAFAFGNNNAVTVFRRHD